MPNISKESKPYSADDTRAVSDNPEWTKKDFAKARRFGDVFPDLTRTIRRRGKQKAPAKKTVSTLA
ncbi:MAG: hypothetical protein WCE79_16035 [Xanthobacteraceae bacterium]